MEIIRRLRGMQDLSPQQWVELHRLRESLRSYLALYGYRSVETPLLEETELFLRKSGGELAAQLYTFADPGGRRVSLRPEFTASVVRASMEGSLKGDLPLRLQYAGPVFRYPFDQEEEHRQFTQVGAELLGVPGPAADAEVLALACKGLSSVGIQDHTLTIGHLGAVNAFLDQLGLSDRGRLFLLGSLPLLKSGPSASEEVRRRATELGLLPEAQGEAVLARGVSRISLADAPGLVESFLRGEVDGPTGQRTPEEILSRYLRRLKGLDEPAHVERALEFTFRLAAISGEPAPALQQARELAADFSLDVSGLAPLEQALDYLNGYDIEGASLQLDLGLARGIAYYTGIVFEVAHPQAVGGPSLCGGGRYDGLVTALGGKENLPALGFAYTAEQVLKLAKGRRDEDATAPPVRVLVVPESSAALVAASRVAQELRKRGTPTELDLLPRSLTQAQDYATERCIPEVKVVREDGTSTAL